MTRNSRRSRLDPPPVARAPGPRPALTAVVAGVLLAVAGGCATRANADSSRPPQGAAASAPGGLTTRQQAASDDAAAAFDGYMRVRVQIAAHPDPKTAPAQLAKYVADPLKVNLVSYVIGLKAADQAVRGEPTYKVLDKVIHADQTPQTVDLTVCVDPDGWYTVWLKNGAPIESRHQPPYVVVAHVEDYGTPYGWLVVTATPGGKSC